MFIRGTILEVKPDRIADIVSEMEASVIPALRQQPGYRGTVIVKFDDGGARVNTFWSDEKTLQASEPAVTGLRQQVAARAGATVERVEIMEVYLREPDGVPEAGTCTRAAVIQNTDDDVQSGIDAFTADILPQLRLQDGFSMAMLAGDRAKKIAVSVAGWRDRAAREAADAALAKARHEVVSKLGSSVVRVQLGEVIYSSKA